MKFKKDKLESLKEKHDNALLIVSSTESKMINIICQDYKDEDYREQLINEAELSGFSRQKLTNIKNTFQDFNEDNIDFNVVSDIMDAQKFIKEIKKESFFSKIANIIPEDKIGNS